MLLSKWLDLERGKITYRYNISNFFGFSCPDRPAVVSENLFSVLAQVVCINLGSTGNIICAIQTFLFYLPFVIALLTIVISIYGLFIFTVGNPRMPRLFFAEGLSVTSSFVISRLPVTENFPFVWSGEKYHVVPSSSFRCKYPLLCTSNQTSFPKFTFYFKLFFFYSLNHPK